MHRHLTNKYGIQIPRTIKIGYGFYIGHGIGIVINAGTVIGNNVNISQFLSIGTNKRTPARIGNNVYIGPNVCIVKDVPENTTVAGCPAKVLGENKHSEYVHNRYNINH